MVYVKNSYELVLQGIQDIQGQFSLTFSKWTCAFCVLILYSVEVKVLLSHYTDFHD